MAQRNDNVTPEVENAFATRSKAIFDGLSVGNTDSNSWAVTTTQVPSKRRMKTDENDSATQFKKPLKLLTTSKYKRDAEKWTCYDLSDVGSDQLSEGNNARAAFEFLQSRSKRIDNSEGASNSDCDMHEIDQQADCKDSSKLLNQREPTRHVFHSKKTVTQLDLNCEHMETDKNASVPTSEAVQKPGVSVFLPDIDSASDVDNMDKRRSNNSTPSSFKRRSNKRSYKKHAFDDGIDEDNDNVKLPSECLPSADKNITEHIERELEDQIEDSCIDDGEDEHDIFDCNL